MEIESLAPGGKGIAHYHDFAVFVERAVPGQIVDALIFKKKKRYAEARVATIINHAPYEEIPPCEHFGICGGCLHQQIPYDLQLQYKRQQLRETLHHVGGFIDVDVLPVLPSPEIYHYRNKMEFSFSRSRWLTPDEIRSDEEIDDKNFALGLHVPGRYDKVLDLGVCLLQSDRANHVYQFVKQWTRASGILPYSTVEHSGYWRFFVIREAKHTGQMMINIITADVDEYHAAVQRLAGEMIAAFPFVSTILHNINRKKAQIAVGDEERILHGNGYINEMLGERQYQISANSFFQTNSLQAERLYMLIREWGVFQPNEVVYDLYCGTGSIAIFIAGQVEKVVGIELVPQAIADANRNCDLNNIRNCHFIEGDLKDQLQMPDAFVAQYGKPDTIIIDPPRSGMHPSLPDSIVALNAHRIVYVSCNPATLARDLRLLCNRYYQLLRVQPVDMFPHTPHCEAIALLERRD